MLSDLAQRLSQELAQALPKLDGLVPKQELQVLLQSCFAKLDLVTREEFDAQRDVLQRTRAKLEQLEKRCLELEAEFSKKS